MHVRLRGPARTGAEWKKHGVLASELASWKRTAAALQLTQPDTARNAWHRHPLAYLTEAADDVAYLLLDLEDGYRLKLVEEQEFLDLLAPLAGADRGQLTSCRSRPTVASGWTAPATFGREPSIVSWTCSRKRSWTTRRRSCRAGSVAR